MKRFLAGLVITGVAVLVAYLILWPYEYSVKFKTKTLAGDVIETVRIWNRSLENSRIVKVDSFRTLDQDLEWKGRQYMLQWKFNQVDDSTTNVSVRFSERGRAWLNKLLIPFSQQPVEIHAAEIGQQFHQILKQHLEITRVKIVGKANLDSAFCICRNIETQQVEKANGMMRDYMLLTTFISDFHLKPAGLPIVKVNRWNHSKGLLNFDFCFPVVKSDTLPAMVGLSYKTLPPSQALKAIYNGNYITSDRAWYALQQFARLNDYKIAGEPIEYFFSNPNFGGNELEWKAEIYLPIKE